MFSRDRHLRLEYKTHHSLIRLLLHQKLSSHVPYNLEQFMGCSAKYPDWGLSKQCPFQFDSSKEKLYKVGGILNKYTTVESDNFIVVSETKYLVFRVIWFVKISNRIYLQVSISRFADRQGQQRILIRIAINNEKMRWWQLGWRWQIVIDNDGNENGDDDSDGDDVLWYLKI